MDSGLPQFSPVCWLISAWMAAIVGDATEVPPNPAHVLGAPLQDVAPPEVWLGSDQQTVSKCPHGPFDANIATSGMSRTPSVFIPYTAWPPLSAAPVWNDGLGYP